MPQLTHSRSCITLVDCICHRRFRNDSGSGAIRAILLMGAMLTATLLAQIPVEEMARIAQLGQFIG
ncbi:hypothetical protein ACFE33_06725 [Falsihalocynthiibacter sp. SS001]|uniref:hypothetical protein n=1 Tax=Falsihalocynthiibacter sp. SS001 TaxID=3349698 RepID=UPI0036D27D1E